ncbi:MAG: dynamin family protein, partial [candidate division WOR-3 bacterium]|nr:dynamin family protein [candidate division WOR-3 bacterium]MDW8150495.1 dynamin family protein [candidate division WOR-3 bacterium]
GFFGKRDEQKLSIIKDIFGIDIKDAKINIIAYGEDYSVSYGLLDIYKLKIEDLGNTIIYESEDEDFLNYCNRVIMYISSKEKNLISKIEEYAKKSSVIIIGEALDNEVISRIEKEILPKFPNLEIKFFSVKERDIDKMLYKAWLYDIRDELLGKEIILEKNSFIEYTYPKIGSNKLYKFGYTSKTIGKHSDLVYSVSFSPDGKYLASGSGDNTIKIWSVDSWKEIITLKGHSDNVYSVSFSPDGKYLASGSYDKTVKIWFIDLSSFEKNLPEMLKDLKDIVLLSSLEKIVGKDIQNKKAIVFFGEFSSGKTTIINNLFELNLPVDILPSTAVPTIITHGQSKKVYLIDSLFNLEEANEEKLSKVSHQDKKYASKYLYKIILLDMPVLKDYIIIDTPGFSADSFDYETAINILKLADKLVYVIDADTGSITKEGLEILKSQKNLDCVVILNKIDKKKEDFEKIAQYNKEILKNNGINAEIELFSSFADEKLIRNWKISIMSELLKKSKNSRFAEHYKKIYTDHREFFL